MASHGTFWTRCAGNTPRDRRNLHRMMWLYALWAVVFTVGSQLIKRDVLPDGLLVWVVAVLPSLVAIPVLVAGARFLREADELQRTIHLQAMALAFGGTWFAVTGYRILERAGAPSLHITDTISFLALFYAIGIVHGAWRYR